MEILLPRRYRVIRQLGRGGQGSVWLVADRMHGNAPVALKAFLWPSGEAPDAEELSREFVTLARLAHPNIARVRDFSYLEGGRGAFFTSDYVGGGNLLDFAYGLSGDTRWRHLEDIAAQALSVLTYLSLRGLRHGDLKPTNLLVEQQPDVARPKLRLIDFGTARFASAGEGDGVRFGTLAYLPPPQLLDGARSAAGSSHEETSGNLEQDLYSLGMTLFHATVGRLPYALGEPAALQAWWKAREPARPKKADPSIPDSLDALITALTGTRDSDRFRSAAEALEFLKGRVQLPPPLRPEAAEASWITGREDFLAQLMQGLRTSDITRVQVIAAPSGSGKTRVLEALGASLQVRGYQTVLFRSSEDVRALREVEDLEREASGLRLRARGSTRLDVSELVTRLGRQPTAILLNDEALVSEQGQAAVSSRIRCSAFLRALAHTVAKARGESQGPLLIAAASSPQDLAAFFGLEEEHIELHPLEPMSVSAIAAMAREFFAVEAFPDGVASRIAEESGGAPARVREALERLADLGAATDFLGHLQLPKELPARLVAHDPSADRPQSLPPPFRRALGLLLVSGEPLDAGSAAARFPEMTSEEWRGCLERLRWRGLVRREERSVGSLYHLTRQALDWLPARVLGAAEEEESRRALAAYHLEGSRSHRPVLPESLLAAANNFLALGERSEAIRFGLRARRRMVRAEREEEVFDCLLQLLSSRAEASLAGTGWRSRRADWVLRLRAAETFTRLGNIDEALETLTLSPKDTPLLYRKKAQWLRSEALERSGKIVAAIVELEALRGELCPAPGATPSRANGAGELNGSVKVAARLASLYFRTGDVKSGRDCLRCGRDFLRGRKGVRERNGELESDTDLVRALELFAAAESAHGEAEMALRFLEEALRVARESGKDALSWGPLNELGILYGQNQRWAEAIGVFGEIETVARLHGDRMGVLRAVYNQAIIHYRLHDLDRAEALFSEARRVSESLGSHSLSAAIWLGFAKVLQERGRLLEALRLYRRVLREGRFVRPNDQAIAHNNLGVDIYLAMGRLRSALVHVTRAFRIARRMQNRFLLALALRSRGRVRSALGRTALAWRDLEAALSIAVKDGDSRATGVTSYYLGQLASASGNPQEAIRFFRAGVIASRQARDLPYVHSGTLSILSELAGKNRKNAARCLLEGKRSDGSVWARGELLASCLRERVSENWPENCGNILKVCRQAVREGKVWEVFRALTSTLEDPGLSQEASRSLARERETTLYQLLRRTPRRYALPFQRFWQNGVVAPGGERPDTLQEAGSAAPRAALLVKIAGDKGYMPALLEDLRQSLGARSVWLFRDSAMDSEPYLVAADAVGGEPAVPAGGGAALEEAGRSGSVVEIVPYLYLRLPHREARRVLCAEAPAGGWPDPARTRERIIDGGAAIALGLRAEETESALATERKRHAETRKEVRRLNTLMVKDKEDLETALITQRLEMIELRREREARGAAGSLRRVPVGKSAAMKAILRRLPTIAAQDIPVLLVGESGVGKDLLARRIHELSPRRECPFLAELCNIADSVMEAELFGFVRGSFTGAVADRPGIFERASGGTIYLDEVGDLSVDLQARLLRILAEKRVRPLGAENSFAVDFRLLSSSCHSVAELQESAALRQDFLYRINAEVIEIPPLRERREDIALIARAIIEEYARDTGLALPYLHAGAVERLTDHSWPGNVRELENEVHRVLVEKPVEISAEMVLPRLRGRPEEQLKGTVGAASIPSLKEERLRVEQDLLLRALTAHAGNASQAARALQITRRYLGMLLEKHGVDLNRFKKPKGKRS